MDPAFEFLHHDLGEAFPVPSGEFTLVIAQSVFTQLGKEQTEHYLSEIARILTDEGVARTTWHLFDREAFPMLGESQVCLAAESPGVTIHEWRWLLEEFRRRGLRVAHTIPSATKGAEWDLYLTKGAGTRSFPSGAVEQAQAAAARFAEREQRRRRWLPALEAVQRVRRLVGGSGGGEEKPAGPRTGHRLRYTSSLSASEFEAKCRELPWWYHSYYFDNGLTVRGDYDMGADVADYGFPESMEGMRVLDVGTGAGWFAFYFEQLGAEVVAVDARGYCDFDFYARTEYSSPEEEGREPDRRAEDGSPIYYSPVSRGFWIMRDILGSSVRFRNSRVYDVAPETVGGEKFDLVFLGALLCHLRDPIGALMAVRRVCKGRVIASTPVVLGEREAEVPPRQYLPYTEVDRISWWLPNEACFRHWFQAAGFGGVDLSRQVRLRMDAPRYDGGRLANGDQILRVGSAFVP